MLAAMHVRWRGAVLFIAAFAPAILVNQFRASLMRARPKFVRTILVDAPVYAVHSQVLFNCSSVTDPGQPSIDVAIFSDGTFHKVDDSNATCNLALLIEPPVIDGAMYASFANPRVYTKFDAVYTFDQTLLAIGARFRRFLFGGSWLTPPEECDDKSRHEEIVHKIAGYMENKVRDVSIVLSNKTFAPGHRFRHKVWSTVGPSGSVAGFGAGTGQFFNDMRLALLDFRYTIVIENGFDQSWYFSEKLVNAMAVGTIPIYWSSGRYIKDIFDVDGMILFADIPELLAVLGDIAKDTTHSTFHRKKKAALRNARIAMQYCQVHKYRRLINELVDAQSCRLKQAVCGGGG